MVDERNILITGGCGFIGRRLIARLNESGGWRITVLDNESTAYRGELDGLELARFVNGDVRDPAAIEEAIADQGSLVHLAAQTGVIPSIENPDDDFDINVRGGYHLLRAAARHGVGSFVFASSAAPIGEHEPPLHEDVPCRPVAPYGASKLAMEGYCSAFRQSFGLNTVVLRFSNCFGPGSSHKGSVVALFIRKILAGEEITIYGDGEQTRDFIYVDDLVEGLETALLKADSADAGLYQLSTGIETSVNVLVTALTALAAESGITVKTRLQPSRTGEIIRNYSRNDKFVNAFDYRPATPLEPALKQTWDYFVDLRDH
ncbi:MAG: SDR family NAD(P)-dependent oxidoreductase [Proteobacteria bacterium]|nr:SDR family NAD(P)-dependent oxidoreductase [Pseudomonadota bacterium]